MAPVGQKRVKRYGWMSQGLHSNLLIVKTLEERNSLLISLHLALMCLVLILLLVLGRKVQQVRKLLSHSPSSTPTQSPPKKTKVKVEDEADSCKDAVWIKFSVQCVTESDKKALTMSVGRNY